MNFAVGKSSQILAHSGSFHFPGNFENTTAFPISNIKFIGRKKCTQLRKGAVIRAQNRPTWLPGLEPPPYLDGTLVGDFGFDPLGLGEDPENLKWYVQAELVHARFAMAGVSGILVTDLLRVTGISNLPVWYEAGATRFDFASTKTLFIVQLLLMGFVETKRYMDFMHPGSQAKEGSFFGIEAALQGLEPGKIGNGGHAWNFRSSKCYSCWPYRQSRTAPL